LEYVGLIVCLGIIYLQWKKNKDWRNSEAYKQYIVTDEFKKPLALGFIKDSVRKLKKEAIRHYI
jgi:restriction system protein